VANLNERAYPLAVFRSQKKQAEAKTGRFFALESMIVNDFDLSAHIYQLNICESTHEPA
jgi:hypothetical protein